MATIYCDDYPNVFHWKSVQEFTIEQAALLLAGIDPFDFSEGLEKVKKINHPRWKYAFGYALSLETAIRRGVLSPVICFSHYFDDYNNDWVTRKIDFNDRDYQISYKLTIITRNSLNQWVLNEGVSLVLPISAKKIVPPIMSDTDIIANHQNSVKELPNHMKHYSEGLELTQEIIDQFWSTYDQENKQTAPTKDEIINYLIDKGVSKNLAEAVDMVLRPFELRKVGRRKKG